MPTFTPTQEKALKSVAHWYTNESMSKQVFYIAGYAGTGKTTLAKHFAEHVKGTVRYATYTGKAAHVMMKKGCENATTIHKLIYRTSEGSRHKVVELQDKLARTPRTSPAYAMLEMELLAESRKSSKLRFELDEDSVLKRDTDLLVIDEISMVNQTVAHDLMSFNKPILVLGDPGQLPPVSGNGYFIDRNPDIVLTEIHRQALDNPIIQLAQHVREGHALEDGTYGSSQVVSRKLTSNEVLDHDIILTGLRRTKYACDARCRLLRGYQGLLPQEGDIVMCTKNDHSIGLLNGQLWKVAAFTYMSEMCSEMTVQDLEDSAIVRTVIVYNKPFRGEKLEFFEKDSSIKEFEYGYAATVHKAQGSQWDNVCVFDQKDRFGSMTPEDKNKWLYTAITRSAERVTIVKDQ